MPRPRKYLSDAEKARAYRMRKKLRQSETSPELDAIAKSLHRLYKKRAKEGVQNHQHLVGKTPFETLIRVVLYEALFEETDRDGSAVDFPGWDKVIVPIKAEAGQDSGYYTDGKKHPAASMIFLDLRDNHSDELKTDGDEHNTDTTGVDRESVDRT